MQSQGDCIRQWSSAEWKAGREDAAGRVHVQPGSPTRRRTTSDPLPANFAPHPPGLGRDAARSSRRLGCGGRYLSSDSTHQFGLDPPVRTRPTQFGLASEAPRQNGRRRSGFSSPSCIVRSQECGQNPVLCSYLGSAPADRIRDRSPTAPSESRHSERSFRLCFVRRACTSPFQTRTRAENGGVRYRIT